MSEPPSLREASVQDIQVELLRRTRFNDMHGEKVCASLLRHRHLWLAALLDRPGVLTCRHDQARELACIDEQEDRAGKFHLYEN